MEYFSRLPRTVRIAGIILAVVGAIIFVTLPVLAGSTSNSGTAESHGSADYNDLRVHLTRICDAADRIDRSYWDNLSDEFDDLDTGDRDHADRLLDMLYEMRHVCDDRGAHFARHSDGAHGGHHGDGQNHAAYRDTSYSYQNEQSYNSSQSAQGRMYRDQDGYRYSYDENGRRRYLDDRSASRTSQGQYQNQLQYQQQSQPAGARSYPSASETRSRTYRDQNGQYYSYDQDGRRYYLSDTSANAANTPADTMTSNSRAGNTVFDTTARERDDLDFGNECVIGPMGTRTADCWDVPPRVPGQPQ